MDTGTVPVVGGELALSLAKSDALPFICSVLEAVAVVVVVILKSGDVGEEEVDGDGDDEAEEDDAEDMAMGGDMESFMWWCPWL